MPLMSFMKGNKYEKIKIIFDIIQRFQFDLNSIVLTLMNVFS